MKGNLEKKIGFKGELNKALDLFFYFDTIALSFVFDNYCSIISN